jgi:hypothetical protein
MTNEARPAGADGQAPDWSRWLLDPFALGGAVLDYAVDAWQRTVLYADIRRQRGNQYRAHLQERAPNVLHFPSEVVLSGKDLPRPVNYGLVRIPPLDGGVVDPAKRPFIVVDPRAGHGPGIGGFKPDSEIGAALKAGHPCYFVGFTPDPVPGQTVEDVMRAEAAFVRRVGELHPGSHGRPAVVANCQAGWQILMTAAVWPELFGPIIVAGAPVSYWAGDNPMRYAGGLTGGGWLTALTSDLGAGRFDGAWLVQNFENLDPANTLWSKQYNLYAKVDTEAERYLGFEKYWGGHVFLNDVEMQYVVDNLFIGNRLATAELMTSDGVRIDLRNIRSPIVVFCSYGDNITPPPQALGWITDLYRDEDDVVGHDQTIVFATHDSIGHLGIFVSASVGRKEHREFASNIEVIDMLPAGIFRAVVDDHPDGVPQDALTDDAYLITIRRSGVDEVRGIVKPDARSERRFAAAARVSEINLALYRNLLRPWVRALSTPEAARWGQALHPLRTGYEWWSDSHPMAVAAAALADQVTRRRMPVAPDNPLLQLQEATSRAITTLLDHYRDHRDQIYAMAFDTVYGLPMVQALAGQAMDDARPARMHPGESPEHRAWLARELADARTRIDAGGLVEAALRAMFHLLGARGETDERLFHQAARLLGDHLDGADLLRLRRTVRSQALLMRLDAKAAVAAIPTLLAGEPASRRRQAARGIAELVASDGTGAAEQARLARVLALFVGEDDPPAANDPPRAQAAPSPDAAAVAGGGKPAATRSAAKAATKRPAGPSAKPAAKPAKPTAGRPAPSSPGRPGKARSPKAVR